MLKQEPTSRGVGILGLQAGEEVKQRRTRQRSRPIPRAWLYSLLGMTTLALAAAIALRPASQPDEPADNWGTPVAQAIAHHDSPALAVHTGCRIARFGLHPWATTAVWTPERRQATTAALVTMGLPQAAARQATADIEWAAPHDVVGMSNLGGTGLRGATYRPTWHTTYQSAASGRVVCLSSRTNFGSDLRDEDAAVWRVEHEGKTWHIAVFRRCQNVSLFTPGPLLPQAPQALDVAYTVPEPGSAWLVLIGLAGALLARRKGNLMDQAIKVWGVAVLAPKQKAAAEKHCFGDCGKISMAGVIDDALTGGLFVCCEAECPHMAQEFENYGETQSFGQHHQITLRLLRPEDENREFQ